MPDAPVRDSSLDPGKDAVDRLLLRISELVMELGLLTDGFDFGDEAVIQALADCRHELDNLAGNFEALSRFIDRSYRPR